MEGYTVRVADITFAFNSERLARAIAATFACRNTAVPQVTPDALTDAFSGDTAKQRQWATFAVDIGDAPREIGQITDEITPLLMRAANQARAP